MSDEQLQKSRLGQLRDYVVQRQQQLEDARRQLKEKQDQSRWRMFGNQPEDDEEDARNERQQADAWCKIHELSYVLEKINQLAIHSFTEDTGGPS